jgi:hypothetical protein
LAVPLAGEGKVKSLTLGSASNGPLLVQSGGDGPGVFVPLTFVDVHTLKPLAAKWGPNGGGPLDPRTVRASANGKVFGLTGWGPVTLVWDEGRVSITHLIQGGGMYVVPAPDGKTVFTDMGVYTDQLQPAAGMGNVRNALPAAHGRYYIAGDSVYILGDSRPIVTMPAEKPAQQPPGAPQFNFNDPLALDKRFHFIPDAKLEIHIPMSNDRLVLKRLDIEAALEKSGIDYLFITSHAPGTAKRGATFRYQLAV